MKIFYLIAILIEHYDMSAQRRRFPQERSFTRVKGGRQKSEYRYTYAAHEYHVLFFLSSCAKFETYLRA